MSRCAAFAVAAVALAGCGGMMADRPMNQPAAAPASASAFDRALAAEYRGLSQVEKEQGDTTDADVFALRAQDAAAGNPTMPDDPNLRQPFFPDDYLEELNSARARLVSALDRTGRQKAPQAAARAQAMYDCWVEQRTEDLQPEHIQACREAYLAAISQVEAALAGVPSGYLVFFDFDRSNLTPEAMEIVRAAAAEAKQKNADVLVVGHADTSGPADYNLRLSARRAQSVKSALVQQGVQAARIQTVAQGETQPLVPTGDGVREPQNRRVRITIQP